MRPAGAPRLSPREVAMLMNEPEQNDIDWARVLVTGDRHWTDTLYVEVILGGVRGVTPDTVIIEGCAAGADRASEMAAISLGMSLLHFPANWDLEGNSAGPIRNRRMLRVGRPTVVLAFHDFILESKGTRDMVALALKASIPVMWFSHDAGGRRVESIG